MLHPRYNKVILQWSVSVLILGSIAAMFGMVLGQRGEWRWLNPIRRKTGSFLSRKRWNPWKIALDGAWLSWCMDLPLTWVISSSWYGNTFFCVPPRPLKAEIDTTYWMDAVRVLPRKQAFMPSWCKSCVAKMKGGEIVIYHNNRITVNHKWWNIYNVIVFEISPWL